LIPLLPELQVEQFVTALLAGEVKSWPEPYSQEFADSFMDLTFANGTQALVASLAQQNASWSGWPEVIRKQVEGTLRFSVALAMQRDYHLSKVLNHLAQSDIPCLLIKGEAVSRSHYPEPHLRWRVDSDVFIRPADIETVKSILLNMGWRIEGPVFKSHQFQAVRNENLEFPLKIDVHWRINNYSAYARVLSFEDAWKQAVELPGLEHAYGMSNLHALITACLHYQSTRISRQSVRDIWLYDIALLVKDLTHQEWEELKRFAVLQDVVSDVLQPLQDTALKFGLDLLQQKLEEFLALQPVEGAFRQFRRSNLALLLDDFRILQTFSSRAGLLRELLLPGKQELLEKYQKQSKIWLPWLYVKNAVSGIFRRLVMR